ncbi:MAG: hypothetical protein AAGI91_12885 [Bacteroidota bacterium]
MSDRTTPLRLVERPPLTAETARQLAQRAEDRAATGHVVTADEASAMLRLARRVCGVRT